MVGRWEQRFRGWRIHEYGCRNPVSCAVEMLGGSCRRWQPVGPVYSSIDRAIREAPYIAYQARRYRIEAEYHGVAV